MPNAVTHILIPLILLSFARHHIFKRKNFPLYLVLIGGIAGLLPDIDVLFYWITSGFTAYGEVHRLFTHNFVIGMGIFLIGLILLKYKDKIGKIFMVVGFGWVIHVLLDAIFSGIVYPFYPIWNIPFGLNLLSATIFSGTVYAGIDAILLVLWLVYEYWQHNIKEYT
ncbi:MAG: metal-dependent hydrolase [archaeon]